MRFERNEMGIRQLLDDLERAGDGGREDVLTEVRTKQAKRSGRLAASYMAQEGGVASGLVYAGAVERGANVGPRRGPHMRGNQVLQDAGDRWPDHVTEHLRRSF